MSTCMKRDGKTKIYEKETIYNENDDENDDENDNDNENDSYNEDDNETLTLRRLSPKWQLT